MEQYDFSMLRPEGIPQEITRLESVARAGQIVQGFVGLLALALDGPRRWRAYCWYLMGQLTLMNPDLNPLPEHDKGLFYYRQAIAEDPQCAPAWMATLQEYTDEPWGHHDRKLASLAVQFFVESERDWPPSVILEVRDRASIAGL